MKANTVTVLIVTGLSFVGTVMCVGQRTSHLSSRLAARSLDAQAFAVTGLCVDKQATHNLCLAPRTLDAQASSNISVTQGRTQASQVEGLCNKPYGGTGPSRMMTTRTISPLTSSLICGKQDGKAPRLGTHHWHPRGPLRIRCPVRLCAHKSSHQPFTNRREMPHRLTPGHHHPTPRLMIVLSIHFTNSPIITTT